jgi:peroxiredoxin/uncharacterized membrane protein YphA (DoxX/SURF4 family)
MSTSAMRRGDVARGHAVVPERWRDVIRWTAAVVFVVFGAGKFVNHGVELASFRLYGLPVPDAFTYAIGVLELLGGLLMAARRLVVPIAVALAGDVVGAIVVSGLAHGELISLTLAPALLIAMLVLLQAEGQRWWRRMSAGRQVRLDARPMLTSQDRLVAVSSNSARKDPTKMAERTTARQVSAMQARATAARPNDVMSVFTREQEGLATLVPEGLISLGAKLPDAALLDPHGAETTLLATLGGRRGVLVFYRGAWCPYCNITLASYQAELLDKLAARGVGLVAVSPQRPDESVTMQEKFDLRFAVLSDPGNQLARSVGVLTRPSAEARAAQLELGLDLETVNADGTIEIPMPATVIVEPDATVRWIDVHPDYSTRSEPVEILTAVDALGDR